MPSNGDLIPIAAKSRPFTLLEKDGELHALIDTVPDAMVVIDENGTIRSFSIGAEQMFGYTEDEIRGENVRIMMPSPDRQHHDGYIKRYCET